MKKIITILIAILLIFSFSVCYAAEISSDTITVKINNDDIVFSQKPISENGRILVPMRAIFEILGLEVSWNEYSQLITASNGDVVITLKIGDNIATIRDINGYNEVLLDTPSKLINNSTFVPVRFISEAVGAEVTWDHLTSTVDIKYGTLFSVSIDDTTITLNDNIDTVLESLGKPDRIDKDITKLDWYVYNKDYKKFIMVGMLNDKVASIYTSNTNFYVNDEIKYGVKKEKLPETGQIEYEIDNIDGILYGVMIKNKNFNRKWSLIEGYNIDTTLIELQHLDCLNAFRVHNGLNFLEIDEIALKTAREHSKDMAKNNYFSHEGLDGRHGNRRYYDNNGKKFACAENIVAGPENGMIQFKQLLNSLDHRQNMLMKNAKYVGIGVFYDENATYRYYGTQLFTY